MPLNGHSYLVAQGWEGKGKGLREGAINRPIAIPQKRNLAGLGKDRDEAFPFWDHLFSVAANSIKVKCLSDDDDSDSNENSASAIELKRTSTGILSNRRPTTGAPASSATSGTSTPSADAAPRYSLLVTAKRESAKRGLYSRFFRGPVLGPDQSLAEVDEETIISVTSTNGALKTVETTEVIVMAEKKEKKRRKTDESVDEHDKGREQKRRKKEEKELAKDKKNKESKRGRKKEKKSKEGRREKKLKNKKEKEKAIEEASTGDEDEVAEESKSERRRRKEEKKRAKLAKEDPQLVDGTSAEKEKDTEAHDVDESESEKKRRKEERRRVKLAKQSSEEKEVDLNSASSGSKYSRHKSKEDPANDAVKKKRKRDEDIP